MINENILTVTQLNNYIKNVFDSDYMLSSILVKGEISNCKIHTSGHIYLTLKDETGIFKAVMFKSSAVRLKFLPENGMKVIVHGHVSLYEKDGQVQLYISSMQPDGMGDLYVAFEQMKAKLEAEGMFDQSNKKPIPKFPKKIAIITSPTGAAVRDILNILSRRYKLSDVTLYPVLVQGDGASVQISKAIAYVNENTNSDVIIVGRGGGSIEDLWAFNEEITARAIYASKIPVISAVGHETDFTISDFVADLRAPTPSAGAELATPSADELKSEIYSLLERLNLSVETFVVSHKAKLDFLSQKITIKSILNNFNKNRIYIDSLQKQIELKLTKNITDSKVKFSALIAKLEALSPLQVLSRGYSVLKSDNRIIKSVKSVKVGDNVDVILPDGLLNAKIINKEEK